MVVGCGSDCLLWDASATLKGGSPVEAKRRQHLFTAAETVFVSRGYVSTTMDDIARAAGMSKKTVYKVVTSKKELFNALMIERLAEVMRLPEITDQPPAEGLRRLLLQLAHTVLSKRHVAMARLVVSEVANSPQAANVLKAYCIQGETMLRQWLIEQATCQRLDSGDVVEAASMLFAIAIGDFHWHLLLGIGPPPSDKALQRRINWAVSVFMREFET